jgi:hypothetical protein
MPVKKQPEFEDTSPFVMELGAPGVSSHADSRLSLRP